MMKEGTVFVIFSLTISRELWRQEAKLSSEEDSAKEEFRKAEQQLHHTMDRNVQTGLAAAARIAKDLKLDGFYGPLYELFTLTDNRYRTAAEVTAGARSFYPSSWTILTLACFTSLSTPTKLHGKSLMY
jgi:chromosome segregation ATPase